MLALLIGCSAWLMFEIDKLYFNHKTPWPPRITPIPG